MATTSRRAFLLRTAAGAGALATATHTGVTPLTGPGTGTRSGSPLRVGPGAPQYADLVRGINQRWAGTPEEIWVARDARDVQDAVAHAVQTGRRPAVRSGGHCFEDFSAGADVRVLIELSGLDTVEYDPERRAFAVGAGARLGDVYERLYKGWGVTVPGGSCPTVGVGGHIAGGGYGPLNRVFGLTVDHLYAVEVVVADRPGQARTVVATRETGDPGRDLWWAHTGGGGGNFGVVTRYWFRSPGASGDTPSRLLPSPPPEQLLCTVIWPWEQLGERAFVRLVRNYSGYFATAGTPRSAADHLYAHLATFHSSGGAVVLNVQLSAAGDAGKRLDAFLSAVNDGVGVPFRTTERTRLPWLLSTQWSGFADRPVAKRVKGKSAMHRTAISEAAATAMYRNLTRADYTHPGSGILMAPYGGQVAATRPGATASPHRDCALVLLYVSEWADPAQDDLHVGFQRRLYREVYAATGGVPVPGPETGGAYVNYPDADLADPRWNTSGVPWQQLYYRDGHTRLRRVKSRWDPREVFRHRMSVRPSAGPS